MIEAVLLGVMALLARPMVELRRQSAPVAVSGHPPMPDNAVTHMCIYAASPADGYLGKSNLRGARRVTPASVCGLSTAAGGNWPAPGGPVKLYEGVRHPKRKSARAMSERTEESSGENT